MCLFNVETTAMHYCFVWSLFWLLLIFLWLVCLECEFLHCSVSVQRCQVSRFRRETPVFRRPLWQDLSPVFTFYLWHVYRWLPHACWWSRRLAARLSSAPLFTYLRSSRINSRCARRCTLINMANWSEKSEKIRNICKNIKMSAVIK